MSRKVAVIGGGPAGMMAAIAAARAGAQTALYEGNEKLGKKLYLTGKGRCNLTNAAQGEQFLEKVAHNSRFLNSAFARFDNRDMMRLLEQEAGLALKTERGGRVFPRSDKSSDVIAALARLLGQAGATVRLGEKVTGLAVTGEGILLRTDHGQQQVDAAILATGGGSYPSTGCDGSGWAMAAGLGHTIMPPRPSLVPLVTREHWPQRLQGLSLKNVCLRAYRENKLVFEELGEMLFTHFGVSGPLVLSASSAIANAPEGVRLSIDLKPGLDRQALDRRLLRDLEQNRRRQFANALDALLPHALIPVLVELSGIPAEQPASDVTRAQRQGLAALFKGLPLTVERTRPLAEAVVTRGGVDVRQVNPSTMMSKLVLGLYFAGEMLDVDAQTGGYNLQIAYSTGHLAGECAARSKQEGNDK